MGLKSNELLKTIQSSTEEDKTVRMATIKQSVSGKYRVQFFGEELATQKAFKAYQHVTGLSVGSTVILTKVNGTYIITGKV